MAERQRRFIFFRRRRNFGGTKLVILPDAFKMSPEERYDEILLRVRSLQRLGKLECTDPSVLNQETKQHTATVSTDVGLVERKVLPTEEEKKPRVIDIRNFQQANRRR